MSKSAKKSALREVPPPSTVTAATMPDFRTVSFVSAPTLKDRASKAHQQATLAFSAFTVAYLLDGCMHTSGADSTVREAVKTFSGYYPDEVSLNHAGAAALQDAITELFYILNHPDQAALGMRVPSDEDWSHYQKQAAKTEGGAR